MGVLEVSEVMPYILLSPLFEKEVEVNKQFDAPIWESEDN